MIGGTSIAAQGIPRHVRVSPREPHSTATFTSVMGEILCTLGLLIILYVFWQLYWTTWMVQGQLDEALADFHSQYAAADVDGEPEHRTGDPPSVGEVAEGEVYAVLHVPQWNWMQIPVAEGTDSSVLDLGYAGHYVTTQQAGEVGNFALAGHRRTYGNNFRRVDILQEGDQMVVETKDAYLVYEVIGYEIVQPNAVEVLYPVPHNEYAQPTERLMTLTTCHPEYGNSERYIVYTKMVYWTDKSEGVPGILSDEPEVGGEFAEATDSALGVSTSSGLDAAFVNTGDGVFADGFSSDEVFVSDAFAEGVSVSEGSSANMNGVLVQRKRYGSGLHNLLEVSLET